jgi:hypothetical protein
MPTYFDLDRRFIQRTKYDPNELAVSGITGKRVKWPQLLENRFVVVVAPANYGKTTEMLQQVKRLRQKDVDTVFVALRKVADRGSFEEALESREKTAYDDWKRAPTVPLTLFVDSLDEASASSRDGVEYLLGKVAKGVSWPNSLVRWVISTRPAVLSAAVLETLTSRLVVPYETTINAPMGSVASAASSSILTAPAAGTSPTEPETLLLFSMAPLESGQAKAYLSGRHSSLDAAELLRIARERGLAGFTTSPGGLDVLANIGLVTTPPESLTEVFQRVVDAVQERQRVDTRIEAAGGAKPNDLKEAAQRLASSSQVCQLPNIELTDDALVTTEGALSARKIVGDMLPDKVLRQLLNTQLFIDADFNQVKLYPDEIAPFLGAQWLASLVQLPEQAHRLVQHFTWQAPTGEQGVYRQFLPLMGWLATLNHHCREELLEREPQALAFFGDLRSRHVPLNAAKVALRESIRRLVDQGDQLGRGMFYLTSENFWQAGDARLTSLLKKLFLQYGSHHFAHDALLDIAISSRSDALRRFVLNECGNSYEQLFQRTIDLRYILELGQAGDLSGLATALKADDKISESVVAMLMTRLCWNHLTAKELAVLVDKQFGRGRGGFSISHAFDSGLVEEASDQQLYELCRAMVVRLARLRAREGRPAPKHGPTSDRYGDLVAETLAALLHRPSFSKHKRVALLCLVMQRALTDGLLGSSNPANLRQAIRENAAVRFQLLSLNVRRAGADEQKLWIAAYGYGSLCELATGDVEALKSAELAAVVRKHEETQAAHRAQQEPIRPARDERLRVSQGVKKELLNMVESLRDGSATNGLAWVAGWLVQTNPSSRYGEVNFEVFEQQAGLRIAQAVRDGFSKVWRNRAPTFKEDEPRTTHHITVAGLQGLHLELGGGNAVPDLTNEEVRSALRYAPFEINGYPKWFWPLVAAHQEVAGQELVQMVMQANSGAVSLEHAEELLTSLGDAPPAVQARLAPLAWAFIIERPTLRAYVIEKLLPVATEVPGVVAHLEFERTAFARMQSAFDGPVPPTIDMTQAVRAQREQSVIWAASWLTANPTAFCKTIEKWLKKTPSNARSFIFELAAYLGVDHGARLARLTQASDKGVTALAALYEWTMAAVRPEDDPEHPDGEAYRLNEKDHAARLRDALIPAIAGAKSQLAYEALEKMRKAASGPRAIYLRNVQFQMREAQYARPPLAQQKYNDFERDFTADITDTTSFAMAIHSDLLAVKYDIERGEHSLRRFFTEVALKRRPKNNAEGEKEGLALEADFQCLLASELHHHSKGRYSVTVEPHTAEFKRRDVLCSKGNMFVSIELKMSMRWTLKKYVEALEKQLVTQYMRHRNATTGFLLIVLQEKDRTWNDPTTGGKLDFKGLLAMLSEKALRLETQDGSRYLRVIGIDATRPENFRAVGRKPTENSKKTNRYGKTENPTKRTDVAKKSAVTVSKVLAAAGPKKPKPIFDASGSKAVRKNPASKRPSAPTDASKKRTRIVAENHANQDLKTFDESGANQQPWKRA